MTGYRGRLNEFEISHFQDEEESKEMHRSEASKIDNFFENTKQGDYQRSRRASNI